MSNESRFHTRALDCRSLRILWINTPLWITFGRCEFDMAIQVTHAQSGVTILTDDRAGVKRLFGTAHSLLLARICFPLQQSYLTTS